jgi:hypothetical protein
MKRPTCRPRVEELEPRDIPSSSPLSSLYPQTGQTASSNISLRAALVGGLIGTFKQTRLVGDTGVSYALAGAGKVRPLGQVTVTGSMTATGFVRVGHAGGTLTLTGAGGTLKLRLVGPEQGGFKPLPTRFHFTVVSGPRAELNQTGIALLKFMPPAITHPAAGAFTLVLEVPRG